MASINGTKACDLQSLRDQYVAAKADRLALEDQMPDVSSGWMLGGGAVGAVGLGSFTGYVGASSGHGLLGGAMGAVVGGVFGSLIGGAIGASATPGRAPLREAYQSAYIREQSLGEELTACDLRD